MPVQLKKIYYDLCDMADKAFEEAGDPCNTQKEFTCSDCCEGCKYLSEDGCTTKCLGCKLYACYTVQKEHSHLRAVLNGLGTVAKRYDFIRMRTSAEDILRGINQ